MSLGALAGKGADTSDGKDAKDPLKTRETRETRMFGGKRSHGMLTLQEVGEYVHTRRYCLPSPIIAIVAFVATPQGQRVVFPDDRDFPMTDTLLSRLYSLQRGAGVRGNHKVHQ